MSLMHRKCLEEYILHMASSGIGEWWGPSPHRLSWAGSQRDSAFNRDPLPIPHTSKISFTWFIIPQGRGLGMGRGVQNAHFVEAWDPTLAKCVSDPPLPPETPLYAVQTPFQPHHIVLSSYVYLSFLFPLVKHLIYFSSIQTIPRAGVGASGTDYLMDWLKCTSPMCCWVQRRAQECLLRSSIWKSLLTQIFL